MKTPELLKLIWSKVDRPGSQCPDIEIGMVRRILGEVMASEIKAQDFIAEEVDQWVLGQVLVSPMSESSLAEDWYETNRVYVEHPQPPEDNYEDEAYQKAIGDIFEAEDHERAKRAQEVSMALLRLLSSKLVDVSSVGREYFGDLVNYRMIPETTSV